MKPNQSLSKTTATGPRTRKFRQVLWATAFAAAFSTVLPAQVPEPPSDSRTWNDFVRGFEAKAAEGTSGIDFELHKGGGTSVYLKAKWQGAYVGAILPENSATKLDGEVVSFRVAEALGFPQLSQPAAYMTLRGDALEVLREALSAGRFGGQKEQNRSKILKRIQDDPEGIPAVFKQWLPSRPVALDSLVSSSQGPNGGLRSDAHLTKYISRNGPMPGNAPITLRELPGNSTPAKELAAQLSNILVADAIVGQWDRFSGGNIQAYSEDGVVRLAALDNGGASVGDSSSYLAYFKKSVTRFDPQTVRRLSAMADFLAGHSAKFGLFEDAESLLESLGVPRAKQQRFATRLAAVAEHVRTNAALPGGQFE